RSPQSSQMLGPAKTKAWEPVNLIPLGLDPFPAAAADTSPALANQQTDRLPRKSCLPHYQPNTRLPCLCAVLPWLLTVAILPMNGAADPRLFDVSVHVSQQEVQIADSFELTIRATAPQGWQILRPVMPADWQGLRVTGSNETTEQTGDHIVWTRHVSLEAYEAGQKTIPPAEVTFAPLRGLNLGSVKASTLPSSLLPTPGTTL